MYIVNIYSDNLAGICLLYRATLYILKVDSTLKKSQTSELTNSSY